jgi:hypothetical protein
MAFGQQSGPPATARQVRELLDLLQAAGHLDFRDARGPMGFTQRQAGGKFTRDEAAAFIEQLQLDADAGSADSGEAAADTAAAQASPAAPRSARPTRSTTRAPAGASNVERALRSVPSELLAAELQRRGWVVMEP